MKRMSLELDAQLNVKTEARAVFNYVVLRRHPLALSCNYSIYAGITRSLHRCITPLWSRRVAWLSDWLLLGRALCFCACHRSLGWCHLIGLYIHIYIYIYVRATINHHHHRHCIPLQRCFYDIAARLLHFLA